MIRRKYYKKLFIIYFALTIFYGVILTSYFAYQNNENLVEQRVSHYVSSAEQTIKNLDQRMWSLNKYADTLYLDDHFKDYILTDKDYFVITNLYDKLRTDMAVFTDMGARIAVSKVEDDLVISNQSTRTLSLFFEEMNFTKEMIEETMLYYNDGNSKDVLLLHSEDYNEVHMISKKNINSKEYLVLLLSMDMQMIQAGAGSTAFDFYFLDREDEVGDMATIIMASSEEYLIDENSFHLLRESGVYPGLYYMVNNRYEADESTFRQYLIAGILFSVLALIGFLVAVIVTRRIYKPIGTVMSQLTEDDEVPTDEFAFLENMTHEIKTANMELQSTIEGNKIDLRTKYIRDLLSGITGSVEKHIDAYDLDYLKTPCRVVLIEWEESDTFMSDYSTEARGKVRKNVYTILQKSLTLDGLYFDLVERNYSSYALVIGEWQIEGLKILLSKLLKAVALGEQVDIIMAIGDQVDDYKSINQSFQQAAAVLDYKQSYDKRAIVAFDEIIDQKVKERFYYPIELEKELYSATINGNIEKIAVIFDQVIRTNTVERHLTKRELSSLLISLMTTLRRIEQKMPLEDEQIVTIAIDNLVLSGAEGTVEAIHEIQSVFVNYASTAREKTASKDDEVSVLMIRYIEEHYHEDISLEEAATYLNISAGYFCTIFKKLTGTNFKSYLNQYRVGVAKKFLDENPGTKIKDLTLQLGYNNVNSFIRMFKKYEGVSPGEYAKRNQA